MKKKIILSVFAFVFFNILNIGYAFATNDIKMFVEGEELFPLTPPIIENGRTLVPVRVISESLGADVDWDGIEKKVYIENKETQILLWIGRPHVVVNQEFLDIPYGIPPRIVNSTTLVPLRFIAEELGLDIDWVEETRSIYMRKSEGEKLEIVEPDEVSVEEQNSSIELISIDSDGFKTEFGFSGQVLDFNSFRLNNRLVVDVIGSVVNTDSLIVNGGVVDRVRLSNYKNKEEYKDNEIVTRIVFDLNPKLTSYSVGVSEHNNSISISFFPTGEFLGLERVSAQYKATNSNSTETIMEDVDRESLELSNPKETNGSLTTVETLYNASLKEYVDAQFSRGPVTDRYRNKPAFIESRLIVDGLLISDATVYSFSSTSSSKYGVIKKGARVNIRGSVNGFSQIDYQPWRLATWTDIEEAINVDRISSDSPHFLQFLNLETVANVSPDKINLSLRGRGILEGRGRAFKTASEAHKVNEAYLLSHALLETGNGSSELARGVLVSSVDGKAVQPRFVYNMYGIGAVDSNPVKLGAETAYKNSWFTPDEAIIGGAKFVRERYLSDGANTIYKMRWNKDINRIWKQYATDIDWAKKQSIRISEFYKQWDLEPNSFDVPRFR